MNLRIGSWLFSPHALLLPLALAFFLTLSARRLRLIEGVAPSRMAAILAAAVVSGVAGAALAGALAPGGAGDHAGLPVAGFETRFGSLGGYWGALLGGIAAGYRRRGDTARVAAALLPGILTGGMVARLGCVFAGCCRGLLLDTGAASWFQPLRPLPVYDIAALALTLAAVRATERRRGPAAAVATFLAIYGILRFGLEFLRAEPPVLGPFTAAQVMAGAQLLAGAAALWALRRDDAQESFNGVR